MPSQEADPIIRRFPWKFSAHISSVAEESQTKTLYKIQKAQAFLSEAEKLLAGEEQ